MEKEVSKLRLYRALYKSQTENGFLKSYSFSDSEIIHEVYSHILNSHTYKDNRGERVIFSFTTDISVAFELLEKMSETYDSICYIDVPLQKNAKMVLNGAKAIVKPVFRFCDWIDMACYNKTLSLNNLNFPHANIPPVPLLNELLPSHNGALSKALAMKEIAVIFEEEFNFNKLSFEEAKKIKEEHQPEFPLENDENLSLFSLCGKGDVDENIIKNLKSFANNLDNLQNVSPIQREFLIKNLEKCEKVFL